MSMFPAGSSYFFKGRDYWRVPGSDMEVESGYPRPIAQDWLLCADMQSDSPDGEAESTASGGGDHAESGYEVCSCTSDGASDLPPTAWLLAPLWTLRLAIQSLSSL